MTAAQPSFASSSLAGAGGGGGGDGSSGGEAQQQQQLQSVSITPVHQQVLTGIVQQNGVIEVSLDSPGDSSNGASNGTSQVTAQVVVSSGNNTPVGSDHSGSEQSLVSPPHYITVTESNNNNNNPRSYTALTSIGTNAVVSDGEGVGADTVAQGVPTYVQYVEGSADQAIYQTANGQMTYPVYAVGGGGGESGSMYTPASGQYYSSGGNPPPVTYSQVGGGLNTLQQGGGGGYMIQQAVDPAPSPASTLTADGGGGVGYMVAGGGAGSDALDDSDPHSNMANATRISPATPEYRRHSFFNSSPIQIQQNQVQVTPTRNAGPGKGRRSTPFGNPTVNAMYRNPSYLGMVQWLLENYETAEGVSLPRSTLYNHYLRHCNEHKLDPVNAASFGKLIRSVFLGLRTRRLGTRGNSKYHYYGIRIKPTSALNQVCDDGTPRQPQPGGGKRFKFAAGQKNMDQYEQGNNQSNHSSSQSPQSNIRGFMFDLDLRDPLDQCSQFGSDFFNAQGHEYEEIQVLSSNFNSQRHSQGNGQHLQYLGDSSNAIPEFPDIVPAMELILPGDCTLEDVDTLRSIYREHFEAFLDAVVNLEFNTIESLWREFWRSQDNNNGDECEEEKYLSKTKLYMLCKCAPVQQFIRRVDYLFYQNLVEVLIPDVLRPIPSSLTQSIRNFAKGLECWLTAAMTGCPPEMTQIKVSAVGALAQTLRRYTSLNHLAQAARAVLQNATQINQMLVDLNRVDFHNVQEQASWVCQCDDGVVQRLENDFKVTLQQQNSLEQWAGWLKGVVQQVLRPYEGKPNYAKAARQFLLKWSFYSSMVIRDLTLRSAASFGSFHLIRLLYDEYMFYLIEHQVAVETGDTPIAVMGEKYAGNPTPSSAIDPIPDGLGLGYLGQVCNGGSTLQPPGLKMTSVDHHHPAAKRHKIS